MKKINDPLKKFAIPPPIESCTCIIMVFDAVPSDKKLEHIVVLRSSNLEEKLCFMKGILVN